MNLSDHFTKFQCKTLKEHFGITTVEQAQALSDDKLKTAQGINVMFCRKLRGIETKSNEWILGYNQGIKDAARISTDNYQKCITYRECEILSLIKNI